MLTKVRLQEEVKANFSNFDSGMARLGFYETNYGIGIFVVYGGQGVARALDQMREHLASLSIPYRNEPSEAGWVMRFVIGLDKSQHSEILGKF
jgi:hypothetical protein